MRKTLAFFIALLICVLPLGVTSVAVNDETKNVSLDDFTSDFVELVNSDVLFDEISGDASMEYGSSVFSAPDIEKSSESHTNRLIVESTQVLDPLDSVGYVYGYNDLHILQFTNQESVLKAIEYYSSLDCVGFVEEDAILQEAVVDTGEEMIFEAAAEYPTSVQSGIFGYTTAKAESDGYDVDIAVIDSGVEINHEFLKGRVVDSGVDVVNNSGTANDDRGHGTHVAGIIVSNTLENVTVHAYKVLNSGGTGSAAQIALAIDAAIEDEVDIINLSMSMKGSSNTLHDAVKRAYDEGISVIVAAGNNRTNLSSTSYSPASFEECITVMSCSNTRKILDTSNYGTPCDFAAPGENILSSYLNNSFKMSTGTSMAAPFICSAAAYLLAKDNSLSPEEIRAALGENYELCTGSPTGKCVIPSTKISIDGFAPRPVFVTSSGDFIGKMYVEFQDSDEFDIFYYLNGDSSTYKHYTKPFLITETTKVTAFCVQGDKVNSNNITATFTKINTSSEDDFVVIDNTLVSYNGAASSVCIPLAINGETVYKIGENVFKDKKNLTSVTLSTTVTEIGEGAFSNCENLLSVSAPNVSVVGESAFSDCKSLESILLNKLQRVEAYTFNNCNSLQDFDFSEVEYVGEYAFSNTTVLSEFNAPLIKIVENNAFESSGVSKISVSNVQVIGDYAFSDCDNITSVIINTTEIGKGTFKNCDILSEISAPELITIPEYCFSRCVSLNNYDFIKVKVVGEGAFEGCSAMENFCFPALTTVRDYGFASSGINSVTGDLLTDFTSTSFSECGNILQITLGGLNKVDLSYFSSHEKEIELKFENAQEIVFPENGMYALFPKLSSFTADKITTLPADIFKDCSSLKECSFDSVTTIGDNAFYGCSSLNTLRLPSVTSAGDNVFSQSGIRYLYCSQLSEVTHDTFSGMSGVMSLYIGINSISDIQHLKFSSASDVGLNNIVTLPDTFKIYDIFPYISYFSAEKLENVPDYCFAPSIGFGINNVNLPNVKTIGEGAFERCSWFAENCTVFYAEEIGANAFNGIAFEELTLINLKEINCDIFGSSAKNIKKITLPDVESISNFSFNSFEVLVELHLDSVKTIDEDVFTLSNIKILSMNGIEELPLSSFSDMTSLEKFSAVKLTEIPDNAFKGNYNLRTVDFGSVTKIGKSAFESCNLLVNVNNGNVPIELGERAFYLCVKLDVLQNGLKFSALGSHSLYGTQTSWTKAYFPELRKVDVNGFAGVYVQTLLLENVEYLHSAPESANGQVIVGSRVIECSFNSITKPTIVARPETYLAQYCKANNVKFLDFDEKNTIVQNINDKNFLDSEILYFEVNGFNLNYKWYGCNNSDMSDACILLASNQTLDLSNVDFDKTEYTYYYCVASSTENGYVVNIVSNLTYNIKGSLKTSSKNIDIDYFGGSIWSDELTSENFINNLHINGDYVFNPSYNFGECKRYGTGSTLDLYKGDELRYSYSVIMLGDVNGDGYINVIDVSIIGNVLDNKGELQGDYHIAASYLDSQAGIGIYDYQAAVNKALS